MSKLPFLAFATFYFLLCSTSGFSQKQNELILLHDEKFNFAPREFYVADVADERAEHSFVASLIENSPDHSSVIKQFDLKDGVVVAIKGFFNRNLPRDTTLRPILVTLKEFKLIETNAPGGRISGHLAIVLTFSLQQRYSTIHLVDYTSGIRYDRPGSQPADVETVLRHGILNGLSYFNNWINSQAETYAPLAKKVKVSFTDYTEQPEGDTIYYSTKRPLTWADFQDKRKENGYEAEVFTTIGFIEHNEVVKGIINVNLAIKVSVAKSDCWVRAEGRDAYILNHEQRHFDIEKLAGEHLKKKIMAMNLPVDNFYGPINEAYFDALRDATRMQKQYDRETHHGQDVQAQERWNETIDKELKSYGIKDN